MQASTSILSRYASRLFTRIPASGSLRRANPRSRRRRANESGYVPAEVLEERTLLSAATFGSVLGVGSTGADAAMGVTTDNAGNRYVTGAFSGTVDFDPAGTHTTLTALGTTNAFVAKYAPDNSLVWARRMGGNGTGGGFTDVGRRIELDGSGNVYVAGEFLDSSADFGSTILSTAGGKDGFVTKLDASGTFQWAKSWGTSANDYVAGVGLDSSGNVYAMGYRLGDAYTVLKYTPTGVAAWSDSIAADPGFSSNDFAVNASGNAFVGGNFQGTVDFDPSSKTHYVSSGPNSAGFVLDLDTNGKFKWVSPFVSQTASAYSGVFSVALDGSGNIVTGGGYEGSVDFNPGNGTTTLPTGGGGFITKLNSTGGLVWARALESSSFVYVRGLAVDSAGSIYATGNFSGTIDLDPSAGTQTYASTGGGTFVVKLDAAANFNWGATFGAPGGALAFGITVDTTGAVSIAGYYSGTADFDPDPLSTDNMTSAGASDMFLLKLNQS